MGCTQSSKGSKKSHLSQNAASTQPPHPNNKYNPDLIKTKPREAITPLGNNEDSLCCNKQENNRFEDNFNKFDFCGSNEFGEEEIENKDEQNINLKISMNLTNHVIPAIMEPNWALSQQIEQSSLLKRRFIRTKENTKTLSESETNMSTQVKDDLSQIPNQEKKIVLPSISS